MSTYWETEEHLLPFSRMGTYGSSSRAVSLAHGEDVDSEAGTHAQKRDLWAWPLARHPQQPGPCPLSITTLESPGPGVIPAQLRSLDDRAGATARL